MQIGDYPNAAVIVTVDRTAKLLYDSGYLKVSFRRYVKSVELHLSFVFYLSSDARISEVKWSPIKNWICLLISWVRKVNNPYLKVKKCAIIKFKFSFTSLGWELLDPFIPIEISNFDKGELDVIIDYYVERK